jgi:hypothetical protein
MPQVGDIVLAAFPVTDLSATKRRLCVVLATADSPGDFVLAFITTEPPAKFPRFGVAVEPNHPSWKRTRLKAPSVLRSCELTSFALSTPVSSPGAWACCHPTCLMSFESD